MPGGEVGQRLDLDAEKRRLEAAGYRTCRRCFDPGDYATRGGLARLYPDGAATRRIASNCWTTRSIRSAPSIRKRSVRWTRSIRCRCCRRASSRWTEAATKAFKNELRERFDIDPRRSPLYQDLKRRRRAGGHRVLPAAVLRVASTGTLFDYLGGALLFAARARRAGSRRALLAQTGERYEQRRHDIERPVLPPAELFLPPERCAKPEPPWPRIEVCAPGHPRFEAAQRSATQPRRVCR
jgi:transcription-repair coupling factor (superfamily II helicase)